MSDYNSVREKVSNMVPNEYELVSLINSRVRELERKPQEGVPSKGTDLIKFIMQEILDGKVPLTHKE